MYIPPIMADAEMTKANERLVARLGAGLRRVPRSPRPEVHLASFLAVREEVAEALEQGYPIKVVWAQLHGEGAIQMTYETFRQYCHNAELVADRKGARGPAPKSVGGMPPQTFEHRSIPDKKRLY